MKKLYVLIIGIIISLNVFGQQWEWVKQIKTDEVFSDNSGNLYFMGETPDTSGLFKCNSNGDIIWVKSVKNIREVKTDIDGNTFILTSNDSLFKLNSNGVLIWKVPARTIWSIGVGNNYLYGLGREEIYNNANTFLIQFSKNGTELWKRQFNNTIPREIFTIKNDTVYFLIEAGDSAVIDSTYYYCNYFCPSFYVGIAPNSNTAIVGNTTYGYKAGTGAAEILNNNYYIHSAEYMYAENKLALSDDSGNQLWVIYYPQQYNHIGEGGISSIKRISNATFYVSYTSCMYEGPCNGELAEMDLSGKVLNSIFMKNVGWSVISTTPSGIFYSGLYSDTAKLGNHILYPESNSYFLAKLKSFVTSNKEITFKNNIFISPNPSSGKFRLQFNEMLNKETKVCIYDVMGRCVYQENFNQTSKQEIDLSGNTKGIYFVEVNAGEKSYRQKVVIQ